MSFLPRFGTLPLMALGAVLCLTGCPKSQDQTAANTNQASTQDQAPDPAAANLAPASTDQNAAAPVTNSAPNNAAAPATYSAPNNAPAPAASNYQQSAPPADQGASYNQASDDPGYGEQPVAYAPQPPPPLRRVSPISEPTRRPNQGAITPRSSIAQIVRSTTGVRSQWVQCPENGSSSRTP